jgi:hypothetical protein
MNGEKLNHWVSIIANFGVLLGIVILVVELNQNTTALQTEATWSRMEIASEIQKAHIEGELTNLLVKHANLTSEGYQELTYGPESAESIRISEYYGWMLIYFEARFLTLKSDQDRAALRGNILGNMGGQLNRTMYSNPQLHERLRPDFREYLLQIISESNAAPSGNVLN